MKFAYRLSKICGQVFENGNLIFTPDGNSVISPVGNRMNVLDLVNHNCITLPFENKKNIKRIAISNNGRFIVTVDVDGHALFVNFPRRVVLTRFHFKRRVYDIKFSPDDKYIAVTYGHGCQLWRTPGIRREFAPLVLSRHVGGFHDDAVCMDWSGDSDSLIVGSKDLSVRVFYRVHSRNMATSVLTGHRARLVGAYYSRDDDMVFTVAQDGAVFTWEFEYADRVPLVEASANVSDDDDSSGSDEEEVDAPQRTKRGGAWRLKEREFLWETHTEISSAGFNRKTNLLVIGFSNGVFGLYDMPGASCVHKLSVSHSTLGTVDINSTGEWLAVGSAAMGQLLVWEWQSESYVIKQQGHRYGLNALDFSSDGMHIATGGEDAKVKVWSATSGFCFVTFDKHIGPVTGVKFVGRGTGKAVISCSLDGTVRAYDMLRYQNFRTLTTPTPVQFTCLAVDSSGEMVCAGALDPFQIFVWSLQTGKLLDVLSGHEGPIACLDFAQNSGRLASGSWDGTLKIWDIYKNECVETMEHGCDVMAVAFRPDGKEVCTGATNGILYFWDVENGTQLSTIEGRRDISAGRKSTDATTASTSARSKYFTSVTYTADGSCVLAGSKSKSVCIYAVASGSLIKKFELSHNRSLEGVVHDIRSDMLVDGVVVPAGHESDEDAAEGEDDGRDLLPGAGKGSKNDGSRNTAPEILTSAVGFSATGREWAAATTQGLQVFSLDEAIQFAPTDLDIAITPQAVAEAIARHDHGLALNMALHLGEKNVLKKAVDAVDKDAVCLVVKSLDHRMLRSLLRFLADELVSSRHIEYYLQWCWALLTTHGKALQGSESMSTQESVRALIRAISIHEREILKMCDDNHFSLSFLSNQCKLSAVTATTRAISDGEPTRMIDQSSPTLPVVSGKSSVDVSALEEVKPPTRKKKSNELDVGNKPKKQKKKSLKPNSKISCDITPFLSIRRTI